MPVDPRLVSYLADPRNTVRRPPPHVPIDKVRRAANAAMLGVEAPPLHEVLDLAVDTGTGRLGLRLYRPTQDTVLPLILFIHGGGWVWGNLDTHDAICRRLALDANSAVMAVDYRLAPETPAADQVDDVLAGLSAALAAANDLGIDAARVALCGDSAGGALALAAALRAQEAGTRLAHLAMIYPALDPGCATPSHEAFSEGYMLTREAMRWFWEMHLGSGGEAEGFAAPLEIPIERLKGLPPATVDVAEYDVLRDEGVAFAARLSQAGVPVRLRCHEGMIHGFLSVAPVAESAAAALAGIASDIAASFSRP